MGLQKQIRRKTKIVNLEVQLQRMQKIAEICGTACQVYAWPGNWQRTDHTKDVKNEAGLVIGMDIIQQWIGQGSGPELARQALIKAGVHELTKEDVEDMKR